MTRERLPCGVLYDDLLRQVADDVASTDPSHQRTCPHCRATLAELTALWAPITRLVDEDVAAPDELLAAVMERVRDLPRHTWHAVITAERGRTRIAARVVGAVARRAAITVPGVRLAVGAGRRPSGTDAKDVLVGVAGTRVVVDVQVAVTMGTDVHALSDEMRKRITAEIARQLELKVDEVNVTIADVR